MMKRILSSAICLSLVSTMLVSCSSDVQTATPSDDAHTVHSTVLSFDAKRSSTGNTLLSDHTDASYELTMVQKNSVAWLNYLAMVSQEIESSQHNRLYLEEVYSSLINNTNPENIDKDTLDQILTLLNCIKQYRIIDTKRERLEYLYNQNKAAAIRKLIPSEGSFKNVIKSYSEAPELLAAAVVFMGIESLSSYESYNDELDQQYLKNGWELDDTAASTLHEIRESTFKYMVNASTKYDLTEDKILTENDIKRFVEYKNSNNTYQKIQFLVSNKNTYSAFGSYWLLLAQCYYENENYQKCLDCFYEYEDLHSRIFREDHEFAKLLPLAIVSASKVQSKNEYIATAERYAEAIDQNSEATDWALRYFIADTYIDLFNKTNDKSYLQLAYEKVLNNVNHLANEQKKLNSAYLDDVREIEIPKDATKEEKKSIQEYNKNLKKKRKTELPSIYEPLAINCDLLFSLSEQLDISQEEKDNIDGILSNSNAPVFLTLPVQDMFSFRKVYRFIDASIDVSTSIDRVKLTLPVSCVSEGAKIKVTVSNANNQTVYEDWNIEEVKRSSSQNCSTFYVTYSNKEAKKYPWSANSTIKVEVINGEYSHSEPTVIYFIVSEYKPRVIIDDYIKFKQVNDAHPLPPILTLSH